ncbi:MAG: hypothetical protein A2Y10_09670 [Planctomycetes bacterium GWF2_41_51]|nr:MAG: hypothetical protein A2Y10_09670 [Planctomycetes bacterium GWF2_41_51]HBG28259.1 hypothetical protein [Phycisphaerales bacterium]
MRKHEDKRMKFWKISFLIALFAVSLQAQNANNRTSGSREVMSNLERRMQKKISVDFKDTPIDDVIRILAQQAGINIIKSPKVSGTVTATLAEVPLEEALNNILLTNGYSYVIDKNVIRIIPVGEDVETSERMASKIYRITYADMAGVENALKQFISKPGTVAVSSGTNNVIVTAKESEISAIDTFISEIDRITPQVLVEVRIYDITSKDRLDLGVDWSIGTNTTFTETDAGTIITGETEPFVSGTLNSPVNRATSSDSGIRFGIVNDNVNINARITAEQEEICATLLANPRILVLDNEKALFKSVSEIPYQQLQETSLGGSIGTTAFREVGVSLAVVPHVIMEDKMIRIRVIPEFSMATGSVLVGGFQVTSPQPVVDSRNADTTLLIKDGQTIVLGGLRKKEVSQQINKVPLLGDIPVLGWAFKFVGEETIIGELVVFITPTIVEQPIMVEADKECLKKTEICTPTCRPTMLNPCLSRDEGTGSSGCGEKTTKD